MAFKKRVRIIKKIREAASLWRFISLHRLHGRYVWDKRPGYFFIEWWEGRKRHRQMSGQTPSEALEAQRRKARSFRCIERNEPRMARNTRIPLHPCHPSDPWLMIFRAGQVVASRAFNSPFVFETLEVAHE